jgi:hypothetical protein
MSVQDEIRSCEKELRLANRAMLLAQVKLLLLSLPAALGVRWAKSLVLQQQSLIADISYYIGDAWCDLGKLDYFGTTIDFVLPASGNDDGDAYDGWLSPDDEYGDTQR